MPDGSSCEDESTDVESEEPEEELSTQNSSEPEEDSDADDVENQSKTVSSDAESEESEEELPTDTTSDSDTNNIENQSELSSKGQTENIYKPEKFLEHSSGKRHQEEQPDHLCSKLIKSSSAPDHNTNSKSGAGTSIIDSLKMDGNSKNLVKDLSASEEHENTGSLGKRRRSRWDRRSGWEPEDDRNTVEGEGTFKRRKSRWECRDSKIKMLGPIQLPGFLKDLAAGPDSNPGFLEMTLQERQGIISKLIQKNPTFKAPSDYKPPKHYKKIYIPVKEYPGYNFESLILGPDGKSKKSMEKQSGAKICLRGKGAGKSKWRKHEPSDYEDLHVRVEADNQESLDVAVGMLEKLLVDNLNDYKQTQLKDLAKLKGTLRDDCKVCGKQGLKYCLCPKKNSKMDVKKNSKMDVSCMACGDGGHPTLFCPMKGLQGSSNLDFLHQHAVPSGVPCAGNLVTVGYASYTQPGVGLISSTENKSNNEIDDAKLFIGYLPAGVDDDHLTEMFSPFGRLLGATVIKDKATGLSKGYGFVNYSDPADASKAVASMNGQKMDGKTLAVRVAGRPPPPPVPVGTGLMQKPPAPVIAATENNSNKEINDASLFIGCLTAGVDDDRLTEMFSPFGKLLGATVIKDKATGLSKCYGFVNYSDPADASKAVASMNGQKMDGKTLAVRVAGRPPPPPVPVGTGLMQKPPAPVIAATENNSNKEINDANLFIGCLPAGVDDDRLTEMFSPFGRLLGATVIKDKATGLSKCYGFVDYSDPADASKAVASMNRQKMDGRTLAVRVAGRPPPPLVPVGTGLMQKPPAPVIAATENNSNQGINDAILFIGNLPVGVDTDCLREMFSPFGRLLNAVVIKHEATGLSKCYGFVEYSDPANASMAVACMDGLKMVDGKTLAVRVDGHPPPPPVPAGTDLIQNSPAPAPAQAPVIAVIENKSNKEIDDTGKATCLGLIADTENKSNKRIDDVDLYVGHLPVGVDHVRLIEMFSPFGGLLSARVIKDKATGLSKGYGFVKYSDPANASKAVASMNGLKIDGENLAVRVAGRLPPPPAPIGTGPMQRPPAPAPALAPAPAQAPAQAPTPEPALLLQESFLSQPARSGPLGSMLPEPQVSFHKSNAIGLPPPSGLLGQSSFSGQLSSSYGSCQNLISSSLVDQDSLPPVLISQFPGNLSNLESQYESYYAQSSSSLSKSYALVNYSDPANASKAVATMNRQKMDGKALAVRVAGCPPPPLVPVGTGLMQRPPAPLPQESFLSQSAWPGPPGSMLPEPQVLLSKSNVGTGLMQRPPGPAPAPAPLSQESFLSQSAWVGPPGSMLPGPQVSFPKSNVCTGLMQKPSALLSQESFLPQSAWPGPPGSILPEPQVSDSDDIGLPPLSGLF